MAAKKNSEKQVRMGLGEAVKRLLNLEIQFNQGPRTDELKAEREMLLTALNAVELDLGFDCNEDGVPDTVEIFQKSAATSCCRILPTDGSRRKAAPKRARKSSRSKK